MGKEDTVMQYDPELHVKILKEKADRLELEIAETKETLSEVRNQVSIQVSFREKMTAKNKKLEKQVAELEVKRVSSEYGLLEKEIEDYHIENNRLEKQVAELEEKLEDWEDGYDRVTKEGPRHDEKHCGCAVDLWKENKKLKAGHDEFNRAISFAIHVDDLDFLVYWNDGRADEWTEFDEWEQP